MGRNVEIKARVADPEELARRVAAVADEGPAVLRQVDTFFHCPTGRLKLRKFADGSAELIFYRRPDTEDPAESRYVRSPIRDPASLEAALAGALGVRGEVRKTRHLYRSGQTRIHLDRVEGLGHFVELEVVLEDGQGKAFGLEVARDLMERLGIPPEALVAGAYVDLSEGC